MWFKVILTISLTLSSVSGFNDGFDSFDSFGESVSNPPESTYSPQPRPQYQPAHATHWTFPGSPNNTYRSGGYRSYGGQPEGGRYTHNVASNNNYNHNNNNPSRHEVFGSVVGQPSTYPGNRDNGNYYNNNNGDSSVLRPYPANQPSPSSNNGPESGSYSATPDQPSPAVSSSYNTASARTNQFVDSNCLECLCQASTGCDLNKQCVGNVCGPYLLSWPFWSDGGSPGTDYVSCSLRKSCAETAIQNYMARFGRDCNNDGTIDCADYVMIHQYGPNCGPGVFGAGKFWQDFKTCHQPSIDARSNRAREPNVDRFRPIERPGQPANLRRDEPITWNGANNRFNENEIPGIRLGDRGLNQPERVNVPGNGNSDRSPFNPFNVPNNNPQPSNPNRPYEERFQPNNDRFNGGSSPRIGNNNNIEPPRGNGFQPNQPTPIPPHLHVGPHQPSSSPPPNRFVSELPRNNDFRPRDLDLNNNNLPRGNNPFDPNRPNDFNNGFQPGPLRTDGFRPILPSNNNNGNIPTRTSFPNQPINPSIVNRGNDNGNFDSVTRSTLSDGFTPRYDSPNGFNFPTQPNFRPLPGNTDYNDPFSRAPVTLPPVSNPPPEWVPSPVTTPQPTTPAPSTTTNSPITYSDREESDILPVSGPRDARLLAPKTNGSMTSECLECICEASTKCDANYPCQNYGGTQACGPYQISLSYWLQSGRPGFTGDSNDYFNCVTNINCAQDTLKGFIKTSGRDCNSDGTIDCLDYALLHKLGPNACTDQSFLDSPYWNDFQSCYGFER